MCARCAFLVRRAEADGGFAANYGWSRIDFCRGEIASFKIPRHVRFVDDWPMGATKILKSALRERILTEMAPA